MKTAQPSNYYTVLNEIFISEAKYRAGMEKQRMKIWAICIFLFVLLGSWIFVVVSRLMRQIVTPTTTTTVTLNSTSCLTPLRSLPDEDSANGQREFEHYTESRRTHILENFTGDVIIYTMFVSVYIDDIFLL